MTFWPFIISCAKPSIAPMAFWALTKYLAEPPPMVLVTKNIAATPSISTSVIQTLKYSMIANTASTIATERISAGSDWLTSWRIVSMSLV